VETPGEENCPFSLTEVRKTPSVKHPATIVPVTV
jgi:hypothetical protein